MSRGFVKEDDQEDIPMVPPRAELPNGVTNYVTKVGMEALLFEKKQLTEEKKQLNTNNENERRIALNHINAKLNLLNQRISDAKIIDPKDQPQNEIRFGAIVTFRIEATKAVQTFQIVGVDEADISKKKISFLSPLAKALINKKKGEKAILKSGKEERVFEVMEIVYQ
jgi:transcription elongation factor GreB